MAFKKHTRRLSQNTDLTGKRFGKLVALEKAPRVTGKKLQWVCRCDCGNVKAVSTYHLQSENVVSCGCVMRTSAKTHGKSYSSEHGIWRSILQRCRNPKNDQYSEYGGSGIYVAARWLTFENFYADMGPKPSPRHSVDRKDGSGPYAFWNCRWATPYQQQQNRRDNWTATVGNTTRTISEWSEITGIHVGTLRFRYFKGLRADTGLFAPVNKAYSRRQK